MKTTLERAGYTVLTADGLSGIKTFPMNKQNVALVLTDLGLPKLEGAAVLASMMEREVACWNPSREYCFQTVHKNSPHEHWGFSSLLNDLRNIRVEQFERTILSV
jgi:hypothetical protein